MIKWTSMLLAVMGLGVGGWAVVASNQPPPQRPPDRAPPLNPYLDGLAAPGIVEAVSRNLRLAAPEGELVARVFVDVNDVVKAGAPLVQLDTSRLAAELARAEAAVVISQQDLERLLALPRPEDLLPLRATLERAEARLTFTRREHERLRRLQDGHAASAEQASEKASHVEDARAARAEAKAQLDRELAGAWEPDRRVARAKLAQAVAEADLIRRRLERFTVRAPTAGVVLKRHVEPGEYATPGGSPLLVLGDLSTLHVRAQVDEQDAPLLGEGAAATATVPGRHRHLLPLRMLRIEPLAIPKSQLTTSPTELVDTRVVEVVFEVVPTETMPVRLYPGQVVDVFIETPPAGR